MMGWFSLSMPTKSGTWLTKGRFTTSISDVERVSTIEVLKRPYLFGFCRRRYVQG